MYQEWEADPLLVPANNGAAARSNQCEKSVVGVQTYAALTISKPSTLIDRIHLSLLRRPASGLLVITFTFSILPLMPLHYLDIRFFLTISVALLGAIHLFLKFSRASPRPSTNRQIILSRLVMLHFNMYSIRLLGSVRSIAILQLLARAIP